MEYSIDPLNEYQTQMLSFWEVVRIEIDTLKCDNTAFKTQDLPLARIKKIMKLDDDIKSMMISAEAPILFAKAAELFIRELTLRAWIHTERNRRRTLQRNDIAMSVSDGDTDQFDFLIDIVPREEARAHRRVSHSTSNTALVGVDPTHHLKTENVVAYTTAIDGSTGNGTVAAGATGSTLQLLSTSSTSAVGASGDVIAATSTASSVAAAAAAAGIQFVSTGNSQTSTAALVVAGGGVGGASTAAGGPIQYVIHLPSVAAGQPAGATANAVAGGQPFHIQLFPQSFQASNTDVLAAAAVGGQQSAASTTTSAGAATTVLTDAQGNTIPIVHVVSQAAGGGLTLPIVQDANGGTGGRAQILQLQMNSLKRNKYRIAGDKSSVT